MAIFDDEDEPIAQFLESEIFALSDQEDEMVEDILDEGDVKRKSKHFDGEEERVTKKMRVLEDEDEIERKEKQEQEEEEEEEKREAKVMKVEEEEEDEEEKVRALLSSPSLSPPTEVEAEVDCASSPPRMSLNIMDNNNNSDASTSSDMRLVPSRIETGILSKVPPELLRHILKFLSPEDLVACSLVCKFLNFAASDESLWRWLYCMRWGLLLPTRKPRECAWKKLYIQRDAEDMMEFVRNTPKEFKEYYIQMQAAKRSQAPLPSQINDDRIILDKTVADQVSMWKKSKGLGDKVVIDHSCSGETCNYYQIGDVYVCEKTGHVHVCDDTCREVVPDPTNGLLVCTISGHCFERMLSPSEMEQDGEQQQGGTTDEAEPFMGSGRFARAYLLGYNCDDEKELEAALRFC
ncbi:PREDICTED: F-box protein SKIP31-like [Nicotiana attenuata]|uniref:F-box protein skip31 n=1 Tax=Nicotiana attenuata TaxID=49451 RepID=A0A314L7X2_NICAT|nr:PREDICTED: F-box protein SKIP31-like [Nicotiana attenuata]OIT36994.1 f-box protein skip31 [Nicotiana attenuata]